MSKIAATMRLRLARGLAPRGGLRLRAALRPHAHDAFARRIAARHAGRGAGGAPMDRAFRRNLVASGLVQNFHQTDQRLALRINVRLDASARPRGSAGNVVFAPPPPAMMPRAGLVPALRRDYVERIFARERRIDSAVTVKSLLETVTAQRDRTHVIRETSTRVRQAQAVPMVTRLAAIAPPQVEAAKTPPRLSREMDGWAFAEPKIQKNRQAAPIPLTPTELGRLTDHVVNAIDRRFTAHRERLGRI